MQLGRFMCDLAATSGHPARNLSFLNHASKLDKHLFRLISLLDGGDLLEGGEVALQVLYVGGGEQRQVLADGCHRLAALLSVTRHQEHLEIRGRRHLHRCSARRHVTF